MLVAYISPTFSKSISLTNTEKLYNKKFLPLCLEHTSIIEPEKIFNLYLGLSFTDPLAPLENLMEATVPKLAEKVLIGLGSSKLVSKIACDFLKNQVNFKDQLNKRVLDKRIINLIDSPTGKLLWVKPGKETDFLDPLPLSFLPLQEKERFQLFLLGVKTIGQLRGLPLQALVKKFGKTGYLWQEYSQGKDYSPLISLYPPDQVTYSQSFPYGLKGQLTVDEVLKRTASVLAEKLQQKSKGCLKLKLAAEVKVQQTIKTNFPEVADSKVYVERSFSRATYEGDILLTNLLLMFKELKLTSPPLKLQVTAMDLKALSYYQLDLFEANLLIKSKRISTASKAEETKLEKNKLEKTITHLQKRYTSSFFSYGKDLASNRREEVLKIWDP